MESRCCWHSGTQALQLSRRYPPRQPRRARPRSCSPTSLPSRAPVLRALPRTPSSPTPTPSPPLLFLSFSRSHASRPTCGSCILDSPGCDAEELRASARPSLPPGSPAETAPGPALTFKSALLKGDPRLCCPGCGRSAPLGTGVVVGWPHTHRGSARLGEFLVFLGHPRYRGEPVYPANLRCDQSSPACLAGLRFRSQGDKFGTQSSRGSAQRLKGENEFVFLGARVAFPLKAVTWEMIFFSTQQEAGTEITRSLKVSKAEDENTVY